MNKLTELAKLATENYVKDHKKTKVPKDFPAEFLEKKAGVFVTIIKNGELRGCIGTYLPTKENIEEEVIDNAILASTEDWRFGPVRKSELPELLYEVSVLDEPELMGEINLDELTIEKTKNTVLKKLDPKKFGIIVKSRGFLSGSDAIFDAAPRPYQKSGLLLPNLEGINSPEEQILIACQKAGINPGREIITIYRFTTKKYD